MKLVGKFSQHLKLTDYHEEFKPMLDSQDPTFKPEHTSLWSENLPANALAPLDNQLVSCDNQIDELTLNQNKLAFEADSLALARDAAQLARLFSEEAKTERATRVAKVCHLRQENQIGSNLVQKHMSQVCQHLCGPVGDLTVKLNQAECWKLSCFHLFSRLLMTGYPANCNFFLICIYT